MTNRAINKAIAEYLSWKELDFHLDGKRILGKRPSFHNGTIVSYTVDQYVPDYCNDLNLMHETENSMSTRLNEKYEYWLRTVCHFPDRESATGKNHHFYRATAKQRAEAFVRTIDKWKG